MAEPTGIIRDLIDKELSAARVVPAEAAARIVQTLRKDHPQALEAWVEESVVRFMSDQISRVMNSHRQRALHHDRLEGFQRFAENPPAALLETWHCINEENTRVRLADMTKEHHLFVANSYRVRAESNLMLESFHRVLAKKVGNRRTGDVLSETQVQKILDNLAKTTSQVA